MAQIADPSPSAAPSPKQLGRQLRDVRKQKGLSRSEVARSAGLTRRELAAYERGKVAVPESDLWCLAGSCGVDVGELLPNRDPLQISSELSSLTVGNSIRHLRATQERDGVLREYLSMIYELRNLPPGSRVPLREADLATLADALGGAPDMIEQRLMELIGASREEAARLRAMILPPLSLPAASGTTSPDDYAEHPQTFDPAAAAEQYFSTPRADDPFGKPPSDDTLAPAPHIDAFLGNAFDDPFTPTDPFAAADPFAEADPNAGATDLFAPPSGEPLSTAPPEADPFAVLPAESGFDPDGADGPIANPFARPAVGHGDRRPVRDAPHPARRGPTLRRRGVAHHGPVRRGVRSLGHAAQHRRSGDRGREPDRCAGRDASRDASRDRSRRRSRRDGE